jgi:hypothetical protein
MTQVIVQKLSESDSAKAGVLQYADNIMETLLAVFACRKNSVHEEAMLAVVSRPAPAQLRGWRCLGLQEGRARRLHPGRPLLPATRQRGAVRPPAAAAGRHDVCLRRRLLQVHGALLPGAAHGLGAPPGTCVCFGRRGGGGRGGGARTLCGDSMLRVKRGGGGGGSPRWDSTRRVEPGKVGRGRRAWQPLRRPRVSPQGPLPSCPVTVCTPPADRCPYHAPCRSGRCAR